MIPICIVKTIQAIYRTTYHPSVSLYIETYTVSLSLYARHDCVRHLFSCALYLFLILLLYTVYKIYVTPYMCLQNARTIYTGVIHCTERTKSVVTYSAVLVCFVIFCYPVVSSRKYNTSRKGSCYDACTVPVLWYT